MIHSTLLINKAGGLIYNKDFTTALNKLSSNESLVLAGTLHGIYALTAQISPVPNSTGFNVLECGQFKIMCHVTLTGNFILVILGLKIILLCDPQQSNIDGVIRKIYEIYADYAMKCPFVKVDMPLRSELFDSAMQKLIKVINS
jgi:hypothetical protein